MLHPTRMQCCRLLCCFTKLEFVSDMSVHNVTEHSDHCPISLDISIPIMTKRSKTMANTRMEGKDRHVKHCYSYRVKWDRVECCLFITADFNTN